MPYVEDPGIAFNFGDPLFWLVGFVVLVVMVYLDRAMKGG